MFGARRTELQPRRLRSPEIQLHRSGIGTGVRAADPTYFFKDAL